MYLEHKIAHVGLVLVTIHSVYITNNNNSNNKNNITTKYSSSNNKFEECPDCILEKIFKSETHSPPSSIVTHPNNFSAVVLGAIFPNPMVVRLVSV